MKGCSFWPPLDPPLIRVMDQENEMGREGDSIFVLKGRLPAIASAASPTAAKAPTGTAPAAARSFFLRFVDLDGFAVEACPIHFGYRCFRILIL